MGNRACSIGLSACVFTACFSVPVMAAQPTSTASIEVVGGPHAGKHTLKVQDVGCELVTGRKDPKRFNSNFGDDSKDPKAFTFMVVRIRNADGPGAPAPADYEASVSFGPVMDTRRGTFYMSGSNPTTGRQGGTGAVLLRAVGQEAQVTLDLQPQTGVTIKGTLICTLLRY